MHYDVLIIGSGIAGLSTALAAAPKRVAVLTRGALGEDGASRWAQGGIAAALATDDTTALHARDTLLAGQHLNDTSAVQRLTAAAAEAVHWLDAQGARFDRDRNGAYALGREAAHSRSRIVHAHGDASGAEVMRCLREATRAASHIHILERHTALQLIVHAGRVVGARAHSPQGETEILASHVVLATGGIGALYRYTTNPVEADASGLALALQAGADLADLEFVQFHPTALAPISDAGGQLPLLTEALRGAGAVLLNDAGKRFMQALSPQAELAPRDVVARAVWSEGQRGRVWLDATRAVGAEFAQRFPTVYASCTARGIDPCAALLPVVPAQHYHMGGVRVDALARSSVPGLYAVGEVACSGVHGANRLASNSLLEGLVFGSALGAQLALAGASASATLSTRAQAEVHDAQAVSPEFATALADLMWQHAGLVRNEAGLCHALRELGQWRDSTASHAARARLAVAERILQAALLRRDSIGAHFRRDAAESRRTG
jgi:L-aspartate oxidase